jgi:hypothetical protein
MKPQGPHLTAEQARMLDDDFFTSRPFAFFKARIASLLESAPPAGTVDPDAGLASEFAAALGLGDVRDIREVDRRDRELCRALDALAVRHHAAEALVRFFYAASIGDGGRVAGAPCTWAAVCNGPKSNADVVAQVDDYMRTEQGQETFWTKVIPVDEKTTHLPLNTPAHVQLLGGWLEHAMRLLTRDDIDISAGYNKFKHGLAVRSRDDMRATFVRQTPGDGPIPLSAVTGPDAVELIDTISVDYLWQPRKVESRKPGLELSTVRLAPATLLAEAWMIAMTYGAMFHVAAARHFAGRDGVTMPEYPDLPVGPTPGQLLQGTAIGIRTPITMPVDGGPTVRGTAFVFHDAFVPVEVDVEAMRTAAIADC